MKQDDEVWRQAIAVYQQLQDLTPDQLSLQLSTMNLSPAVIEKVHKLSTKIQDNSDVLELGSQQIFAKAVDETALNSIIGKTIGSYKILGLIAKGGMSSIFKAINTQAKINKPVALKLLSPYVFSDKAVELFKREQLILSRLQHPNIVSFHHSGTTEDGTHYLIMEYVEGAQTIKEFCEHQEADTKEIIRYVIKLAKILAYAHSNLIIHRDIKPANVLIDQHGGIKVIDFGIAQIAADEQGTSTRVFTKDSASPEQILGKTVSTQTDVFSLGAILLELLVKEKPLPDINIVSYNPLEDTRYVNQLLKKSNLDKDLQNIIRKAMHIDVSQRYQAMGDFIADMGNWLKKKPISATSDSFRYKASKFVSRNPLSVSFAFLLFMSLIIGLIIVNEYAEQAQNEADKANETLALITEIFSQTDSLNPPDPNKTLIETLESFSENKLPELELDTQVLARIHGTLGTIYGNYGLYNRSEQHFKNAIEQYSESEKAQLLTVLKWQNDLGAIERILGDRQVASNLLSRTLENLRRHHPGELKVELEMMINLMDSFYPDQYDLPQAKQEEQRMLQVIGLLQSEYPLVAANAYSAISLKQQHQNPKNMQQASDYLAQAIKQLDYPEYHNSSEFLNANRSLAILKYRENKLEESSAIFADFIDKLQQAGTDRLMLVKLFDDYSSILFKKGDYESSIDALDESIITAIEFDSEELLFSPLSKRAMYHIRLNNFHLGVKDQLELLDLAVRVRKDQLHSTLFNLAMMFYAIGYAETAQYAVELAIEYIDDESANYESTLLFSHLSAGVADWFANDHEKAKFHWQKANQINLEKYQSYHHLLAQLLNQPIELINTAPEKKNLLATLNFLLSINEEQLNEQLVKQYCVLPPDFISNKNFAIKQLFLNRCAELFDAVGLPHDSELEAQQEKMISGQKSAHKTTEAEFLAQIKAVLMRSTH